MFRMLALACAIAGGFAFAAGPAVVPALAQQPQPVPTGATPPYGAPISLDQAKRVMAAA